MVRKHSIIVTNSPFFIHAYRELQFRVFGVTELTYSVKHFDDDSLCILLNAESRSGLPLGEGK
jgi:hypothetical protein